MSTINKLIFLVLFILVSFLALKFVSKAYENLNLLDQEDDSEN